MSFDFDAVCGDTRVPPVASPRAKAPLKVSTFGTPVSPILDAVKAPSPEDGSRMIFARRTNHNGQSDMHWVVSFHGIPGLSATELAPPIPCEATLRDLLEHLADRYAGKLRGAWLMVAPQL